MSEEIDHKGTDEIVCPHCGHVEKDSWERGRRDSGSDKCGECGGGFDWERRTEITYTTHPHLPAPAPARSL